MTDETAPAAADEAPRRWCANRAHLLPARAKGRCQRCNRQTPLLSKARNTGAKICENGHGLIQRNLAEDGSCNECAFIEATATAPGAPIRPVPTTWLDWAAVHAILDGREIPRALSLREIACLLTTLQARRPEWGITAIVAWIDDCTTVDVNETYASYIINQWWRRQGLPDPRITLEQAVFAPVDGDEWIAEEIARLRAERELEGAA